MVWRQIVELVTSSLYKDIKQGAASALITTPAAEAWEQRGQSSTEDPSISGGGGGGGGGTAGGDEEGPSEQGSNAADGSESTVTDPLIARWKGYQEAVTQTGYVCGRSLSLLHDSAELLNNFLYNDMALSMKKFENEGIL